MKIHELKTHTNYFHDICYGGKNFEVRKNDRNFKKGDFLLLKNWDPSTKDYGYGFVLAEITYILDNAENFGLNKEMVVLAMKIHKSVY